MTTEKLFLEDAFLTQCSAVVLECRPCSRREIAHRLPWEILLDRTVCFPEGGGQPSDHGTLGDIPIGYAYECGGQVWHCCTQPLEAGEPVLCSIDFDRRFDLMQQHTGEHLFCAAAFKLYGAHNVGFHLNEEHLMVDFDLALDDAQLAAIEAEVNRYLLADAPITAANISPATYAALELRKKAEGLEGDIRLVQMGDFDRATCCGTHCRSTGQVGMIGIVRRERYKGGTRVEFACGGRLLKLFHQRNDTVLELGRRFSVTPELVTAAVQRTDKELADLKSQLRQKSKQMAAIAAEAMLDTAEELETERLVCQDVTRYGEFAKDLSELFSKRAGTYSVLWSISGDTVTYYTSAPKGAEVSARTLCSALNTALQGKGGGNELTAQGRTQKRELLHSIRPTVLALLQPQER